MTLTACSNPETPQEVTRAFWEAVTENDGEATADLSTLVDKQEFAGTPRTGAMQR